PVEGSALPVGVEEHEEERDDGDEGEDAEEAPVALGAGLSGLVAWAVVGLLGAFGSGLLWSRAAHAVCCAFRCGFRRALGGKFGLLSSYRSGSSLIRALVRVSSESGGFCVRIT